MVSISNTVDKVEFKYKQRRSPTYLKSALQPDFARSFRTLVFQMIGRFQMIEGFYTI